MILSDSMASDCCGWGGGVYGFFKPNATVINYAMAWTSTKVFLQSAEKDKMLLVKPDYVIMEYGFIDGAGDPVRSTTHEEFANNLKTIVQMVRGFNGVPILLTLHAARLWENGRLIPSWYTQNGITRRVARELKTPLIDLYEITHERFDKLGPEGCDFMVFHDLGPGDFMHFSRAGAEYVSRLIVNALPDELGPYLTDIFDPSPTPRN